VLAQGESLEAIQARVGRDPFVANDVVKPDIVDVSPSRADPRLEFLLGQG
jgi:uncharacterized protein YciI